ncbi:MAG: hypothetical protein PHE24_00505 [Patescibacteria group bacterium]|nr:hypothetical protein [Patescibacteria group bacterium]
MKKTFWLKIIPLIFCLSFILLSPVQAAGLGDAFSSSSLGAAAGTGYDTKTTVYQIIGTVIQALLSLLGVIFISLIIYGGITWMTAEGEETKIEKAQSILRSAIIGLVVVLAAYAISFFVISALNISVFGNKQ